MSIDRMDSVLMRASGANEDYKGNELYNVNSSRKRHTFDSCSRNSGVSFAQAFGAMGPLGGNSQVIVFKA